MIACKTAELFTFFLLANSTWMHYSHGRLAKLFGMLKSQVGTANSTLATINHALLAEDRMMLASLRKLSAR